MKYSFLILILLVSVCINTYAKTLTTDGETYIMREKTVITNSKKIKIEKKDIISTAKNTVALIELNNIFYYVGKDSKVLISTNVILENGIMFERKTKMNSLNTFRNEVYNIRFYTDKYPLHAGKLNSIYILSKKNINIDNAAVRKDTLPIVKFTRVDKYNNFNVYRSMFGIHIGWRENKMPFSASFKLDDETSVQVKIIIDCMLTPAPPPKPKQIKGVTSKMTNIIASTQKSEEERTMLHKEVYKKYNANLHVKDGYIYPSKGRYSSIYGAFRGYTANYARFHEGFDIANIEGTPIYAVNDGIVKISRDLFVRGNCVVIEHGEGVFSSYFHMSKLIVKESSFVRKGEIIGEIGMTGMATGNHVHWEMRAGNVTFDPVTIFDTKFKFNTRDVVFLR